MGNPLPWVTIAIPVHRRLEYLPAALACVAAQGHPAVNLLVSDNGVNGSAVPDLGRQHYAGPWTFRQNPATVSVVEHLNQLVAAATGEYFVLLCDDVGISPTFVSELVGLLERKSSAHVAIARATQSSSARGARSPGESTIAARAIQPRTRKSPVRASGFLHLLDRDNVIAGYAADRPDWPELRNLLRTQCGNWHLGRWLQRYQHRLSAAEWVRAAFVVPHVPGYYRQVGQAFADVRKQRLKQYVPGLAALKAQLRRARP